MKLEKVSEDVDTVLKGFILAIMLLVWPLLIGIFVVLFMVAIGTGNKDYIQGWLWNYTLFAVVFSACVFILSVIAKLFLYLAMTFFGGDDPWR